MAHCCVAWLRLNSLYNMNKYRAFFLFLVWQSVQFVLRFPSLSRSLANAFKISPVESGSTKTLHTVPVRGCFTGVATVHLKFTPLSLGLFRSSLSVPTVLIAHIFSRYYPFFAFSM